MSAIPDKAAEPGAPEPPFRKIRKGSVLSDHLRQKAVALFEQGFGYKACAGTLGISVYTARDWLHEYRSGRLVSRETASRTGQGRRREPAAGDHERARQMRQQGCSYNEIACAMGLSRTTVRSWLQDERAETAQEDEGASPRQMDLF